jgi:hypothetical protein
VVVRHSPEGTTSNTCPGDALQMYRNTGIIYIIAHIVLGQHKYSDQKNKSRVPNELMALITLGFCFREDLTWITIFIKQLEKEI